MKRFLFLSLLIFISFNVKSQINLPKDILTVSYCDLVANPEKYDQKIVRVRAFYAVGFETSGFSVPLCDQGKHTWVIYDPAYKQNTEKQVLEKFEKSSDTSPVTDKGNVDFPSRLFEIIVIGKFDGIKRKQIIKSGGKEITLPGTGYGHLRGFNYQLTVRAIEQVSPPALPETSENYLKLEGGVKAHKEIDDIYRKFNMAYKRLDADLAAGLYAQNANYLASGSPMREGEAQIRENFAGFFENVRKNGNTMEISFRILQREVDKNLGYDVGIYTLKTFKDGQEIGSGKGKFVVITKKLGNNWVFQYDSYSGLPPENTK